MFSITQWFSSGITMSQEQLSFNKASFKINMIGANRSPWTSRVYNDLDLFHTEFAGDSFVHMKEPQL